MPDTTSCLVTLERIVSRADETLLDGKMDLEVIGALYVTWYDSTVTGGTSEESLKAPAEPENITTNANSTTCDMDKQKKKVIPKPTLLREKTSFQPQALYDELEAIDDDDFQGSGADTQSPDGAKEKGASGTVRDDSGSVETVRHRGGKGIRESSESDHPRRESNLPVSSPLRYVGRRAVSSSSGVSGDGSTGRDSSVQGGHARSALVVDGTDGSRNQAVDDDEVPSRGSAGVSTPLSTNPGSISDLLKTIPHAELMKYLAAEKAKGSSEVVARVSRLREREMESNAVHGQITKSRTYIDTLDSTSYYKKNANVFFVTITFNDMQVPEEFCEDVLGWSEAEKVFLAFEKLFMIVGTDGTSLGRLGTIFKPMIFSTKDRPVDPGRSTPQWRDDALKRIKSIERHFKYEPQHSSGKRALHIHGIITVRYTPSTGTYMHINLEGIRRYFRNLNYKSVHILSLHLPHDSESVLSYIETPTVIKNQGGETSRLALKVPRIAKMLTDPPSSTLVERGAEHAQFVDDDSDTEIDTPSIGVKRPRPSSVLDPTEIISLSKTRK